MPAAQTRYRWSKTRGARLPTSGRCTLYGIDGALDLAESTIGRLVGYAGSRPPESYSAASTTPQSSGFDRKVASIYTI